MSREAPPVSPAAPEGAGVRPEPGQAEGGSAPAGPVALIALPLVMLLGFAGVHFTRFGHLPPPGTAIASILSVVVLSFLLALRRRGVRPPVVVDALFALLPWVLTAAATSDGRTPLDAWTAAAYESAAFVHDARSAAWGGVLSTALLGAAGLGVAITARARMGLATASGGLLAMLALPAFALVYVFGFRPRAGDVLPYVGSCVSMLAALAWLGMGLVAPPDYAKGLFSATGLSNDTEPRYGMARPDTRAADTGAAVTLLSAALVVAMFAACHTVLSNGGRYDSGPGDRTLAYTLTPLAARAGVPLVAVLIALLAIVWAWLQTRKTATVAWSRVALTAFAPLMLAAGIMLSLRPESKDNSPPWARFEGLHPARVTWNLPPQSADTRLRLVVHGGTLHRHDGTELAPLNDETAIYAVLEPAARAALEIDGFDAQEGDETPMPADDRLGLIMPMRQRPLPPSEQSLDLMVDLDEPMESLIHLVRAARRAGLCHTNLVGPALPVVPVAEGVPPVMRSFDRKVNRFGVGLDRCTPIQEREVAPAYREPMPSDTAFVEPSPPRRVLMRGTVGQLFELTMRESTPVVWVVPTTGTGEPDTPTSPGSELDASSNELATPSESSP